MKNLSLVLVLLSAIINTSDAQTLGSKEVLLDNESVQVIRLTYPVGTESGMHTHVYPNRVAYFVRGGKLETIPGDPQQAPQQFDSQDGDTLYMPATTHNVRNIGVTEVIIIETEIKQRSSLR